MKRETLESVGAAIGSFIGVVFVWLCLGAAIIFGYQVIVFLMDGVWPELSFLVAIEYVNPEWVENPQSWKGLHKLFMALPLTLGMAMGGLLFVALCLVVVPTIVVEFLRPRK